MYLAPVEGDPAGFSSRKWYQKTTIDRLSWSWLCDNVFRHFDTIITIIIIIIKEIYTAQDHVGATNALLAEMAAC